METTRNNKTKLRVGVIGCGRISVMHLVPASVLETAELVACCDVKEDRARDAAERFGIRAYTDYKEMIEKEALDAVHICLPHYLHVPVSVYAFEHGLDVLSEKPMSIDYDSAVYAVRRAKECGVNYGIIFQTRYGDAIRFVKQTLESGKLGRIVSARSTLTWTRSDDYYNHSDWKGTWDKEGGGVVIDQAIHSIDLTNWMIDSDPISISCSMARRGHKYIKVEDTADAFITYKNGVKYGIWCMNNYGCDEPIEVRLYCENGKVVFDYDHATVTYNDGSVEKADQTKRPTDYTGGGKDYWGDNHIRQIRQFYDACLGKEPLEITAESALRTHYIITEMYKQGRKALEQSEN